MRYTIKYLSEVFSADFAEYITNTLNGEPATGHVLMQIMREVEHYETKRNVEFVSFFSNDMIIFRAAK